MQGKMRAGGERQGRKFVLQTERATKARAGQGDDGTWTRLADCLAGCRELETADRRGGAGVGGSETRGWINGLCPSACRHRAVRSMTRCHHDHIGRQRMCPCQPWTAQSGKLGSVCLPYGQKAPRLESSICMLASIKVEPFSLP